MKKFLFILSMLFTLHVAATDYYFSETGNDANLGLSHAAAWKTITKFNTVFSTLNPGDNVWINTNVTWRGSLNITKSGTALNRITIGSYGSGAKPLILGSKQENELTDWVDQGGNIWMNSDPSFTVDVANLIFNNEASCGVKIMNVSPILDAQGEFWYDHDNDRMLLYSIGNPASVYSNIECALKGNAINMNSHQYINFENLDLRYFGTCGWEYGGNYLSFDAVDVHYIGGADQLGNYAGRYGNGLQMWQGCHDIIIQNCWINQVYDAGISPQGYDDIGYSSYNLYMRNNLITNCEYSFEFFLRPAGATANNIFFENNTCLNAGGGWGHNQRPDGVNGEHVRLVVFTANKSNIYIRNNIFANATERIFQVGTLADLTGIVVDNNLYYQSGGGVLGQVASVNHSSLAAWKAAISQEANAVSSNPLFVSPSDFTLQPGSPAIDAGVDVGQAFLGESADIGAYEFNGNASPTANAGGDLIFTFPTNSTTVTGGGTDADGTIEGYFWEKVAGSEGVEISNATTATPTFTWSGPDTYQFRLTVTDNGGATATDVMQLTVNPAVEPGGPAAFQYIKGFRFINQ